MATKRISIKFGVNGEGVLKCHGLGDFPCLGRPGVAYPKDLTVKGEVGVDKFRTRHSNEFNVDMPFAILIWGQRGIYIHEMPATLAENGGPTAGCIHVGRGDAEKVYNFVNSRTRVTIDYPW